MSFEFTPAPQPFPRWWGPYTPSQGNRSGFRFHRGRLGTWVGDAFWSVRQSRGVELLQRVVRDRWGGGRVLLLPNGFVVKPLQEEDQRGMRELIGCFSGDVVLVTPDGDEFTLGNCDGRHAGSPWPGPRSTGLSCVLQANGSLRCEWPHPDADGTINETQQLTPPNAAFANTFRAIRGITAGAVRVTANGAVITSWLQQGQWKCHYIGNVDVSQWTHCEEWIESTSQTETDDDSEVPCDDQNTGSPVRTEDTEPDDDEEWGFDYSLDQPEDIYECNLPPPEIDEDEDEDVGVAGEEDADEEDLPSAERQKLLRHTESPGSAIATPSATHHGQHAGAQPGHLPEPTGFWNWVTNKLKGKS